MSAQTILAAHLIALGFEKGDPPVQSATGLPIGFKQRETLQRSPRMLLLVEESMPALLRALARQYGAKLEPGEVPTWGADSEGCWFLGRTPATTFGPPGYHCIVDVPTLTADMDRLEALVAVIEWLVSR